MVWGVSRKGSAGRPRPSSPPQPAGVCGRERGSGRWGGVVPSRGWGRRVCVGGCRGGWMRCGPVLRGIGPYARRFFLGDPPSGSRPHPGASSSPFPPPGASSRRTRPRGLAGPAPRSRLGSSRASPVVLASLFLRLPRPGVPAPASARGTPRCPFADASAPWGSRGVWKGAGIGPGAAPTPAYPGVPASTGRARERRCGVGVGQVRFGVTAPFLSLPSLPPSRPAPRRPVVPLTTGFCRLVFPGRRRCPWLGKRNLSPLPLQASKQAIHSYFSLASRDLRSDVATR